MAITAGTNVPSVFTAGDSQSWQVSYADYPASSWSLTYYFTRAGEETISLPATANGDDFLGTLSDSDSSQFKPGRWRWKARASLQGTGAAVVDKGISRIRPDPAADPVQSHADKMVLAITSIMLERAGEAYNSSDQAGTSLGYKTDAELADSLNYWQSQQNRERARLESAETGRPRRNSRIWLKS